MVSRWPSSSHQSSRRPPADPAFVRPCVSNFEVSMPHAASSTPSWTLLCPPGPWHRALIALLGGAIGACGTSPTRVDAGVGDSALDSSDSSDMGDVPLDPPDADRDTLDGDGGCTGSSPMCAFGCGGDAFFLAECAGGEWRCPSGSTPIDDCPPGSCFGLPLPGEVCGPNGWECRPDRTDSGRVACGGEEKLCIDCVGFEAFETLEGCACTCDAGAIRCEPSPDACEVGEASTIFGVRIRIALEDCSFSRAELEQGVDLAYLVEVDADESLVLSRPLDSGGCDGADDSGLRTFARIEGGGQSWCICDSGRCPFPGEDFKTLNSGTWTEVVRWDGRNWFGPSDFGNPPGPSFPPGEYTFSIRAAGDFVGADGRSGPWDITVTAPIFVTD